MGLDRTRLPDPASYYEGLGLRLTGRGKWRSTSCEFHGGRETMRINLESGGFCCMAGCGAKGGDVLAYEMARTGTDFMESAKALGAWVDDGRPAPTKPTPLPARAALEILGEESNFVAICGGNVAKGVKLSDSDRQRLMRASGRILRIRELFA